MNNYEVKILKDNTIEVYNLDDPNKSEGPFLRQDIHPDGRPWENKAEAQAWIDNLINEWNNPTVPNESDETI